MVNKKSPISFKTRDLLFAKFFSEPTPSRHFERQEDPGDEVAIQLTETALKNASGQRREMRAIARKKLEPTGGLFKMAFIYIPPRQNAVRMSKELSFRSVTHFRLRNEIIGKQIKLPHREVQNQKVRLRKEK